MIALESEDSDQIENAIIKIVNTCIIDEINTNDLSMVDIEYLFLKIRSKSVGETINIIDPCANEECDEEAKVKINLEDIVIENKDINNRIDLGDNLIIDMKTPTVKDREQLKNIEDDDTIIATVAASLETIYYGEDIYDMNTVPLNDTIEFLGNLNTKQFAPLLENLFEQPYVTYKNKWTCKKCGHVNERNYNGLIDFFI
jgi:rubrerythrin